MFQRKFGMRHAGWMSLIVICGLFLACLRRPDETPTPLPAARASVGAPTAVSVMLSPSATAAPSPTLAATRSPLPTATPSLPVSVTPLYLPPDYIPHPALYQIAPPVEQGDLYWQDEGTLKYQISRTYSRQTECLTETWGVYTVQSATQIFSDTVCSTDAQQALETLPPDTGLNSGDIIGQVFAPDKAAAFVLTQIPQADLTLPKLGNYAPEEGNRFFQGWLVDLRTQQRRPAFYTIEDFRYVWAADSQHIIAVGDICYGGAPPEYIPGTGLFSIDVATLAIHTIEQEYITGCEGSIFYQIAPDGRHILYEPGIVADIEGTDYQYVCNEGEYARSYTWNGDGRYAYVACGNIGDTLRRYDTQTGQIQTLVDRETVHFKAIEMAVSPQETYLAFVWAESTFITAEPHNYGIWIINLTECIPTE